MVVLSRGRGRKDTELVSVVSPGRWKLEFSTNDDLSVVTEFEAPATFADVKVRLDLK